MRTIELNSNFVQNINERSLSCTALFSIHHEAKGNFEHLARTARSGYELERAFSPGQRLETVTVLLRACLGVAATDRRLAESHNEIP